MFKVQQVQVGGVINTEGLFEKILGMSNVEDPGTFFPSRVRISLDGETHPVYFYKSGKYLIFGCKTIDEGMKLAKKFEKWVKEI